MVNEKRNNGKVNKKKKPEERFRDICEDEGVVQGGGIVKNIKKGDICAGCGLATACGIIPTNPVKVK